jgi:hypothetical protein
VYVNACEAVYTRVHEFIVATPRRPRLDCLLGRGHYHDIDADADALTHMHHNRYRVDSRMTKTNQATNAWMRCRMMYICTAGQGKRSHLQPHRLRGPAGARAHMVSTTLHCRSRQ